MAAGERSRVVGGRLPVPETSTPTESPKTIPDSVPEGKGAWAMHPILASNKAYLKRIKQSLAAIPPIQSEEEFIVHLAGVRDEADLMAIVVSDLFEDYLPGEGIRSSRVFSRWIKARHGPKEDRTGEAQSSK